MVRRWSYGSLVARTRLYREGKLVLEDFPVGDISEHLEDEDACVWLDYCDPTKAELATIAEEFQLHPLAVEDAINAHQRPKLDRYDTHLFLSAYAVKLDTESGELCTHEVGAFITPRALPTPGSVPFRCRPTPGEARPGGSWAGDS
jgi:magnesium transporter